MKAFILFFTLCVLNVLSAGEPGKLTVTWLDLPVHGLAAVVETPAGRVFLVDTGGTRATPEYNAGRDTISPFLKARGHGEIDGIVISHPHGDHYGGAEWLLNNWKVDHFIDHGYEGRGQSLTYTRLRRLAAGRGGVHHPRSCGRQARLGRRALCRSAVAARGVPRSEQRSREGERSRPAELQLDRASRAARKERLPLSRRRYGGTL